ncbi:MAG: hypothetical protein AMXMBFR44_2730 [Candidatus Campbellbacteria bacterium]
MDGQQEAKKPRISKTSAVLMVATAIILDLVSIIPAVGQALADVGSFVIFLLWFLILGVPLVTPKKLLTTGLAYVIEVIPAISALPAITAGVIIMIVLTRAEDATGLTLLDSKGIVNPLNVTKSLGKNTVSNATPRMNDILTPSA